MLLQVGPVAHSSSFKDQRRTGALKNRDRRLTGSVCTGGGGDGGGEEEGGGECGQTGAAGFNHLILVFHPLLKQNVCTAGSGSFLPLYVGERLPVPAVLKETVRAAV